MMHDFLHQSSPAGSLRRLIRRMSRADAEAIAAGPWLPGLAGVVRRRSIAAVADERPARGARCTSRSARGRRP